MKISSLTINGQLFLAPMAGITNLAYRLIMKSFGAALVYSEMISANGLIRNGKGSLELLASNQEESPLGVQLFGDDPKVMATAARQIEASADLIDLNLGCPVNKVVRSGAGSALLRDPARTAAVLQTVRATTAKPLTIKIRSGWDQQSVNYLEIGRIAQEEGIDAVTLHPRTRSQGFSGEADWEHISALKEALTIPVIGSGDLFCATDAVAMLRQTGCDAVMIGRGSYGQPWLFRDANRMLAGQSPLGVTPAQRTATVLRHLECHKRLSGEQVTLFEMRKNLCWYARGLPAASDFRRQVNLTKSYNELADLTVAFFQGNSTEEAS